MSIPLPNLDDRLFADLVTEMQARIARYAPGWTNHNVADPGMMLLELFAWLTEATIYRINRVPEQSRIRFLQMLGGAFQAAEPAVWKMKVCVEKAATAYTLPRDSVLTVPANGEQPPFTFETLYDLPLSTSATAYVNARQTTVVANEVLGKSNGAAFQLFPVTQSPIALPPIAFPIRPVVTIKNETWQYTARLPASTPNDAHFTVKPWLNMIVFGDGKHGRIPRKGADIYITYRTAATLDGVIRQEYVGKSNGSAFQYFALRKKILPLDLQALNPLAPEVMVDCQPWHYRPSIAALGCDALEFTVEPWRNAIRFGDGCHGQIPPRGAHISVTYRQTLRPMPTLAPGTPVVFQPRPGAEPPSPLLITIDKMRTGGSDPTTFEQARDLAMAILKPHWRAITVDDFERLLKNGDFGIGRAQCLPGRNIEQAQAARTWPGHVSVAVVPQAQYVLQRPAGAFSTILELHPAGTRLISVDHTGTGALWNLENGSLLRLFTDMKRVRQALFGADGKSVVVTDDEQNSALYNAQSGEQLVKLAGQAQIIYSPQGAYLVDMLASGAGALRDSQDGAVIAQLWQSAGRQPPSTTPAAKATFTTDDTLLAALGTANELYLWETLTGARSEPLQHDQPVRAFAFSPESKHLATLSDGGWLRLWRTDTAKKIAEFYSETLAAALKAYDGQAKESPIQGMIALLFNADGSRLAVQIGTRAWLWSTRTGKPLADLALALNLADRPATAIPETGNEATVVSALSFSPDGNWLSVVEREQVLRLWNARRGAPVGDFDHQAAVKQVVFSPNSRMVVTLSAGQQVRQWALGGDEADFALVLQQQGGIATLSPNGAWFGVVANRLLQIWSTEQKKVISTLYHERDAGALTAVAASAPGRYLYTLAQDAHPSASQQTIRLWQAEHIFAVDALLKQRRLVTSQHHVAGPFYQNIYIRATLALRPPFKTRAQLQDEICNHALSEFFHPLRGGVDGTGWPWGRNVYASEVYQLLERVEGVDHVESLTLSLSPTDGLPVEEHGLTALEIPAFHLVNYVVQDGDIQIAGQAQLRPLQVTYRTR